MSHPSETVFTAMQGGPKYVYTQDRSRFLQILNLAYAQGEIMISGITGEKVESYNRIRQDLDRSILLLLSSCTRSVGLMQAEKYDIDLETAIVEHIQVILDITPGENVRIKLTYREAFDGVGKEVILILHVVPETK